MTHFRNKRGNKRQSGMILVTIMVVSLACMMLVSVLVNQFAINEARAIEQLLADSRFYWAMDGHTSLILSKAANIPNATTPNLCTPTPCTNDDETRTQIAALNLAPISWVYNANDNTKSFSTIATVYVDTKATAPDNGRLVISTSLSGIGAFFWQEIFAASSEGDLNINPLQIFFCVSPASNASCTTTNNVTSGFNVITNVTRQKPFP